MKMKNVVILACAMIIVVAHAKNIVKFPRRNKRNNLIVQVAVVKVMSHASLVRNA
jgi:hypothetical protein